MFSLAGFSYQVHSDIEEHCQILTVIKMGIFNKSGQCVGWWKAFQDMA